jgi:hypothetical protein
MYTLRIVLRNICTNCRIASEQSLQLLKEASRALFFFISGYISLMWHMEALLAVSFYNQLYFLNGTRKLLPSDDY